MYYFTASLPQPRCFLAETVYTYESVDHTPHRCHALRFLFGSLWDRESGFTAFGGIMQNPLTRGHPVFGVNSPSDSDTQKCSASQNMGRGVITYVASGLAQML